MSSLVTSLPDRAAWIAGMRAVLDMLEADPEIPLPHGAAAPVKFYVPAAAAEAIAARLEGARAEDRPGFIFDHAVVGTLAGAEVLVYTGTRTGGTA